VRDAEVPKVEQQVRGGARRVLHGRVFAFSGDDVLVTTSQALVPVDANKQRDLYRKDLSDGDVRTPLG
jgi:hypothetical protein